MDNISVKRTREIFGQYLAIKDINKFNKNDYIVVGCPNSGIIPGKNYAKLLNLPYKQIISKNKNTNRSFILPSNEQRIEMCKNKFNIDSSIKNKNIILIDDSIVRGNTLKILIQLLRLKECKEVHIRISSPPIKGPCYYGIDIPTHSELISYNKTIEDIRIHIDADSLEYLTIEDLHNSLGNINNFCISCFTDKYTDINDW
jgi:amidophosphoribosyltransferase